MLVFFFSIEKESFDIVKQKYSKQTGGRSLKNFLQRLKIRLCGSGFWKRVERNLLPFPYIDISQKILQVIVKPITFQISIKPLPIQMWTGRKGTHW